MDSNFQPKHVTLISLYIGNVLTDRYTNLYLITQRGSINLKWQVLYLTTFNKLGGSQTRLLNCEMGNQPGIESWSSIPQAFTKMS